MKIMTRDFVGGLAAIVLAGFYLMFAFRQRVSALADTIGPAGMPKVLGFLMLSLGLVLCAQSVYQSIKNSEDLSAEWQGQANKILKAFGLLGLAVAYLLLVGVLGYAITIALLLGLVALYLGAEISWKLGMISVAGAALLWAIFVILLDVEMPAGIFG